MSNLLPCPFCESERIRFVIRTGNIGAIYCISCNASSSVFNNEADAIDAWNSRHTPTPSTTQQAAAAVLAAQEAKGLSKYGTTLDTANLSLLEIATHYQQEAADALMYATAMVELMKKEAKS